VLIFSHTCLVFKDLKRTYFCEIYVILWDLIEIKKISFQYPKVPARSTGGRPNRSTGPVIGRPERSTNVHEGVPMVSQLGR